MTSTAAEPDRRLCIAPMMDWTDRYCRSFLRLFSAHTLLYTEMVTTGAILHGNRPRFLDFDAAEQPLAIQIGGSEPGDLAATAAIAESWGYREINLNVGCPSDRVQSGRFGACLMGEPELVADCVAAMQAAVKIPVTIKTRIGIDDRDDYEFLHRFVELSTARGCRTFIVHARKAWLQGLSPKENREIPPLRYDVVARLKSEFPQHEIILNGGIRSMQEILQHLETFDGVMIGREAYSNPYLLATADQQLFGDASAPKSREQIVEEYLPYVELRLSEGVPLNRMTRHMLGLFQGQAGARHWRRYLSEHAHEKGAGTEVIRAALHARNAAAKPVSS